MNPNFQNALRRASAHPVRTGFLWAAGVHLADLTFALIRLLVLVAVLGAIAWGTWALMKRDPSTKPIAAKPAIEKTNKHSDKERDTLTPGTTPPTQPRSRS